MSGRKRSRGRKRVAASPIQAPQSSPSPLTDGSLTSDSADDGAGMSRRERRAHGAAGRTPGRGLVVLRGAGWQAAAQLAPLVVNLALTPFVITRLGKVAYGLFLVASTLTQFLSQFDGGIRRSSQRYFSLYAGARDRASSTRMLLTLLLCVALVTSVTLGLAFVFSPAIVDFFHAPEDLTRDTVLLLRVMVVIVGVALARNLFAAILNAHERFALNAIVLLIGYVIYAVGLVFTLNGGMGLRGVAYTLIAQQLFATVTVIPSTFRHLDRGGFGLMPRAELRTFLAFAWKVQFTGLLSLVGLQGSTLIVGRMVPAQVPDFGPGATFALQLRMMPVNAIVPMQSVLGRALGSEDAASASRLFERLQTVWVTAVCGFVAAGAPAAYYGVNTWLPLEGNLAGTVAALLLVSHLFPLLLQLLFTWALLLKRPEIELRSGVITVVLTLGLSVVFVPWAGSLGVVLATITGQVAGFGYTISRVPTLPAAVPSPLSAVPWLATAATAALSAICVTGVHILIVDHVLPRGALGLVLCGLAAAPALAVYVAMTIGWTKAIALVKARGR